MRREGIVGLLASVILAFAPWTIASSADGAREPIVMRVPAGRTTEEVRDSIKLGLKGRRWNLEREESGAVLGNAAVYGTTVPVRLEYDEARIVLQVAGADREPSALAQFDREAGPLADLIVAYLRSPELDVYRRTAPAMDNIVQVAPIPWLTPTGRDASARMRCNWNRRLVDQLVDIAAGRAVAQVPERPADASSLKISIEAVNQSGRDGDVERRIVRLAGELRRNETLAGSFKAMQAIDVSNDALCPALNALADELALDIAIWLRQPTLDAKLGLAE